MNKKNTFLVVESELSVSNAVPAAGQAKKLCPYCKGKGYIIEPALADVEIPCAKCAATGWIAAS